MELPLKDGQAFTDSQFRNQVIAGSIRSGFFSDEFNHDYCWTIKGNWFRRSDGVEVTGAYRDENNNPVTIEEAFKRRRESYKGS